MYQVYILLLQHICHTTYLGCFKLDYGIVIESRDKLLPDVSYIVLNIFQEHIREIYQWTMNWVNVKISSQVFVSNNEEMLARCAFSCLVTVTVIAVTATGGFCFVNKFSDLHLWHVYTQISDTLAARITTAFPNMIMNSTDQ